MRGDTFGEGAGMRLGSAVYTYLWQCSLEEAIERCARFGFATVELMTTPPFVWPAHAGPFERRRLRRRLADAGVEAFSLNPTFIDVNIISLDPAIRAASVAEIEDNIRFAADVGARLVVVSPGRRHPLIPSPLDDALDLATEQIARFARLAGELGVIVGVENLPAKFVATGAEVRALVERVGSPHCRAVFDVANAHMVEDPAAGLRAVAPYLDLVHLSDTHRHAWAHLPLGMGEVDLAGAVGALREIGFAGPALLETTYPEDPDGGIRASIEALVPFGLRP